MDQCQMPEDFLAKGSETERTKELREREERMEKSAFKKRLDYDDYQKVMRGMKTIVPSQEDFLMMKIKEKDKQVK